MPKVEVVLEKVEQFDRGVGLSARYRRRWEVGDDKTTK